MNDSNDLLVRMNRLERQHRRLRLFFTGALVLLGVALVSGQAGPQAKPKQAEPLRRVEAQEFVLVDAHGVEWGSWSVSGEVAVFFLGKKASKRNVSIGVSKETTGIAVIHGDLVGTFGATGEDPMMVSVGDKENQVISLMGSDNSIALVLSKNGVMRGQWTASDEDTSIEFYDKFRKTRGSWRAANEGFSAISFYDKAGTRRSSMGVLNDGLSYVRLNDKSGKSDCYLSVGDDGNSQIVLWDNSNKPRGLWKVTKDGNTSLQIYDESGSMRASLGNTEITARKTGEGRQLAESSLVLFDKDGKVLFKAP